MPTVVCDVRLNNNYSIFSARQHIAYA